MNRPALLPGLILLGLGLYFFLQQFHIPFLSDILNWPVILIVIGLSFIICSFSGWDKMMILPGGILLSIGIIFLGMDIWSALSIHWSMYPGAVGVGFLLAFIRTKETSFLVPACVLLAFPFVFYVLGGLDIIQQWWPIALVLVGIFLIFRRK
jgi:hypothetical protein